MHNPPSTHTNGKVDHHAAPPPVSGGALHSARSTSGASDDAQTILTPIPSPVPASPPPQSVFPPDLAEISLGAFLHDLAWAEFGGQRLRRWLIIALVAVCLLLLLLAVPGVVWFALAAALLIVLTFVLPPIYRRTHFVRFVEEAAPLPAGASPHRLPPAEKIAVHVSGTLSVNGKRRDFLWLPAFYRTFATREHALLCLCRDRRILGIGAPPEADLGLWYAFWYADQVVSITAGKFGVGKQSYPGMRILYQPADKKGRLGAAPAPDTLYIACATEADRARIWHDHQADTIPAPTALPTPTPIARQ